MKYPLLTTLLQDLKSSKTSCHPSSSPTPFNIFITGKNPKNPKKTFKCFKTPPKPSFNPSSNPRLPSGSHSKKGFKVKFTQEDVPLGIREIRHKIVQARKERKVLYCSYFRRVSKDNSLRLFLKESAET
ncbi:unnamed protein product [Moneuplotes crassus]|uniref:Uncharacterized protein n=1 Tax=Euplotes crassus TaxID=5936 RepID=A0AAD1UL29_EUPCR|nr:unnamed protein product [Moneuplotes crassus]